MDFLPPNVDINIGYVAEGSLPNAEIKLKNNHNVNPQVMDPLWSWLEERALIRPDIRGDINDISSSGIESSLISIEKRYLTDSPVNFIRLMAAVLLVHVDFISLLMANYMFVNE